MSNRAVVLDAKILIRAVLGTRVRRILEDYADDVSFFVPELALSEAREHLATVVDWRGGDPAEALRLLDARRNRKGASALAIRTTGLFSHLPSRLDARSGLKTPTS